MSPIITLVFFILLVLVIYNTLNRAPFFQEAHPMVMSICVSILCLLGTQQAFEKIEFNLLLLPYGALAIALLSVLLLGWLSRFRKSKNVDFEEESGEAALKIKKIISSITNDVGVKSHLSCYKSPLTKRE